MKKILFSIIALSLVIGSLFYWNSTKGDSHNKVSDDQITIIRDSIRSLHSFENSGDAAVTIAGLNNSILRFQETKTRALELGVGEASEDRIATIDQLSGELLNYSLNLELSKNEDAPAVVSTLEKLMNQ